MYPFQKAVLPQMVAGKPIYLGFDPGLGKSRTALEAARARGDVRVLVIAPTSGKYVWASECAKWMPGTPFRIVEGIRDLGKLKLAGVTLITYGLLSQKDSPYANAIRHGADFDMTVLDEAAAVKNSGANRTRSILTLMLPRLGYLVPMSGTPAPNHAGELFPILRAVYPQALAMGGAPGALMNEYQFQDQFCKVVNKSFGTGKSIRVIEGSKNLDTLKSRMNGFMVRVKKADVLKDLPSIRWDVVPIQPKADSLHALPKVPENMSDDDLLKYLSGASGDEHVMRLRRLLGISKIIPAIEYIQDFMANLAPRKKVLVFAHHREVIQMLDAGLQTNHPVVLTGASVASERRVAVDTFLNDPLCRMFIGNIAAAGTGLTLVGPRCDCSDVIFVEASYAVGDNVQAAARVHRIGQKEGVVARFLTAHHTIDDRIQSILARKAQDFEQLFS